MTGRGGTAAQSEGNGLRECAASCKIMHVGGDRTSVPVAPGGWGAVRVVAACDRIRAPASGLVACCRLSPHREAPRVGCGNATE